MRPTFVSITPDYDYVDGCAQVVLQGHHLGTEATARIGDAAIDLVPWEDPEGTPEQATDVGFKYSGTVPPSPTGEPGFFDVTMTIDGEDHTVRDGFYYRSCPPPFTVDGYWIPGLDTTYTPVVGVGDAISFQGCGLDDQVQVQILEVGGAGTARMLPPPDTGTPTDTGTTPTGTTTGTTTTGTTTTGTTTTGTTTTGTTTTGTITTGTTTTGTTGDTSVPPDTGTAPTETGAPTDTGTAPTDTGTTTTATDATPCDVPLTLVATVNLISDCGTAYTHIDIPSLPPGEYHVRLVHADGTVFDGGSFPHTADTGITCAPISFVIGGAK